MISWSKLFIWFKKSKLIALLTNLETLGPLCVCVLALFLQQRAFVSAVHESRKLASP